MIKKIILASFCSILFTNSTLCMLMCVNNCSSKKAIISFCFYVRSESEQSRNVAGKLKVAAGKFKEWKAEQKEEEKKGNIGILSFKIGKKLFEINQEGKYWFLEIENDKRDIQARLSRLFDSLYEEAGKLPNGLVAQQIRKFSGDAPIIKKTVSQALLLINQGKQNN